MFRNGHLSRADDRCDFFSGPGHFILFDWFDDETDVLLDLITGTCGESRTTLLCPPGTLLVYNGL